jgi:hypothetical protein
VAKIGATLALSLALCSSAAAADEERAWSGFASAYQYWVPDADDLLNTNVAADHGGLHLEARHNYEGHGTWSLWMGWNFKAGTSWELEGTAMLGGVFGDFDALAPGYRFTLSHSWFYLASEAEYVLSTHDHESNYLYSWNEIAGSPTDGFRVGIAGQRTRAYESDLDIQRGPFVGFTWKQLDVAAYAFNLDEDATYVLAVRFDYGAIAPPTGRK